CTSDGRQRPPTPERLHGVTMDSRTGTRSGCEWVLRTLVYKLEVPRARYASGGLQVFAAKREIVPKVLKLAREDRERKWLKLLTAVKRGNLIGYKFQVVGGQLGIDRQSEHLACQALAYREIALVITQIGEAFLLM